MLINDHNQFLYKGGPETGKLFKRGDEIPEGWFDRPDADEWENKPKQPKMEMRPVWLDSDGEEVEFEDEEKINAAELKPDGSDEKEVIPEQPAWPSDEDILKMYCSKCDKKYQEIRWFNYHMKEKHDVLLEE